MEATKRSNEVAKTAQRKSREPETGDRLSSLPDEIISHILSFLPTKYAIGTAVLSRRWNYLWTGVSNLDLDNRLVHNNPMESRLLEIQRRDSEFCRFVDRVLTRHKNLSSLRRFRFHFTVSYFSVEASRDFWSTMESESGSQLEEIDVKLESCYRVGPFRTLLSPPVSLYTLSNVKVLKLAGVVIMLSTAHDSVYLPSVKTLQLSRVNTMDSESLHSLISGCPVLETAHLENCSLLSEIEKGIRIAYLPSLKNLMIMNDFESSLNPLYPIAIEAPSLEHLHLQNCTMLPLPGDSPLACLHSAWVDIGEGQSSHDGHLCMLALLPQISDNAKEMFLSSQTLDLLSFLYDVHQLPVDFPKLTHLTVRIVNDVQQLAIVFPHLTHLTAQTRSGCVLHHLLNSASRLESLVLDFGVDLEANEWEESELPVVIPDCLLSSLKEIEIRDLAAAHEHEMKIVAYLLEAGAVLKKVNVHTLVEIEERAALASLVLKLPRGSSDCEVRLFHSDIRDKARDLTLIDITTAEIELVDAV